MQFMHPKCACGTHDSFKQHLLLVQNVKASARSRATKKGTTAHRKYLVLCFEYWYTTRSQARFLTAGICAASAWRIHGFFTPGIIEEDSVHDVRTQSTKVNCNGLLVSQPRVTLLALLSPGPLHKSGNHVE